MEIAYLDNEIQILTDLSKGMGTNSAQWAGQPVTKADVDLMITQLGKRKTDIEDALEKVSLARNAARDDVKLKIKSSDQVTNLARGIHAMETEKLVNYNIKERAISSTTPVPGMAVVSSVKDDTDGIGFVITIQPLANATDFDIERSVTTADITVPGEFKHLKSIKKLTYIDDDVIKGMRYHYRATGFNRNGSGKVSASISAVQ